MPTLSLEGAVKRSDGVVALDIVLITQSLLVTDDSFDTIVIAATDTANVAFGPLAQASFVFVKSDEQLDIVLSTPGPTALSAITTRHLYLENTEIVAMALTNLSTTDAATVRVVLGGA
jgi:hypothetical protein